jgi:hypothetical protein
MRRRALVLGAVMLAATLSPSESPTANDKRAVVSLHFANDSGAAETIHKQRQACT